MSFHTIGHINKHRRISQAARKETRPAGVYQRTMFWEKGAHCGRLAVWDGRMEWDVFTDDLAAHVDWNHPDCKALDGVGTPATILEVVSELAGQGWRLVRDVSHDTRLHPPVGEGYDGGIDEIRLAALHG